MSLNQDNSHLTPLKIPGKRHRKPAAGAESNKRRKPGRPRKDEKKKQRAPATHQPSSPVKGLENMKLHRKLSTIEKLPTEVIQNIFLHSMNFNLPRASPVFGVRLSSEYVYTQTIINALSDTWMSPWEGKAAHEVVTDLLKCRWITVPLLRQARRKWLISAYPLIRQEETEGWWYDEFKPDAAEGIPNWPDTLEATLLHDDGRFDEYHSDVLAKAKPFDSNGEPQLYRGRDFWRYHGDTWGNADPPEHILKGPWTDEKLQLLAFLAWAGPSISYAEDTTLPEVASQGLQDAIREGNLEAIACLVEIGLEIFSYEDVFAALATTSAPNKAILIVRVLDMFFCEGYRSRPKGSWDHWVEDIIKLSGQGGSATEGRESRKALEAEVYEYARGAYRDAKEFYSSPRDPKRNLTAPVKALLARSIGDISP